MRDDGVALYLEFAFLEGANGDLQGGVASIDKHHISGFLVFSGKILFVDSIGQGNWR